MSSKILAIKKRSYNELITIVELMGLYISIFITANYVNITDEKNMIIEFEEYNFSKYNSIDIVMLYVNGSDPKWIKDTESIFKRLKISDSEKIQRFSNNDELKHSLRSIDKFIPWVRKIHLITRDQIPSFLDQKGRSKIQLVSHKQLFGDDRITINSKAIQFSIDKVPDLAEHFIIMDDDFFFVQPMSPSDFFDSDGVPKIRATGDHFYDSSEETYQEYKNKAKTMKDGYTRYITTIVNSIHRVGYQKPVPEYAHLSLPYRRSDLIFAFKNYDVEFMKDTIYRSSDDLNFQNLLMASCYKRETCKFVPSTDGIGLFGEEIYTLKNIAMGRRPEVKMVCINSMSYSSLKVFYSMMFPTPSSFEKK